MLLLTSCDAAVKPRNTSSVKALQTIDGHSYHLSGTAFLPDVDTTAWARVNNAVVPYTDERSRTISGPWDPRIWIRESGNYIS